jgi:hypothetical protein
MWWLALSCAEQPPAPDGQEAPDILPDARGYAAACVEALGPIPALDCADVPAVVQLATLDDGTVLDLTPRGTVSPDGTCDRPSILSGCAGGSRAGVLANDEGSTFWLSCRVSFPDTPEGLYDDVALIGRADDGSTCQWGVPENGLWKEGGAIPTPGSEGDDFWAPPEEIARIACRTCHDGNGIVVTPFIAPNLGDVPLDPDAPMHVLFEAALAAIEPSWEGTPLWVHPDAAPCRSCHELPQGPTCTFGPNATGRMVDGLLSPALRTWPTDRWMDDTDPEVLVARHGSVAGWESMFGAAADRLLGCCGGLREGCWDDANTISSEGP